MKLTVTIPGILDQTYNPNKWIRPVAKNKRGQEIKGQVKMLLTNEINTAGLDLNKKLMLPVRVSVTRYVAGSSRKLDGDNFITCLKPFRDGLALALGINDGAKQMSFEYHQERGAENSLVFELEVEEATLSVRDYKNRESRVLPQKELLPQPKSAIVSAPSRADLRYGPEQFALLDLEAIQLKTRLKEIEEQMGAIRQYWRGAYGNS